MKNNQLLNPLLHITLFIIFSLSSISAQRLILYDLDSYKQVVFERDMLFLTPSGSFSAADQLNVVGQDYTQQIRINGFIDFDRVRNTEDVQYLRYQRANISVSNGYKVALKHRHKQRRYSDNRYHLMGFTGELNYDRLGTSGNRFGELELNISGDIGFGFGRIEYINHAWSAVQILQSLENNGLLLRIPNHDEITAFADVVGRIRTARILDSRLRDIDILERIIEYLVEKDMIDNLSTKAILIIQDTYRYDEVITRESGSRLEFAFTPYADIIRRPNDFSLKKIEEVGLFGKIENTTRKNIDVHWYRRSSFGACLDNKHRRIERSNNLQDVISQYNTTGQLSYRYGYSYLPNLRNSFRLSLFSYIEMTAIYGYNRPTLFTSVFLRSNLSTTYAHYFSPATQFVANAEIGYIDEEFQANGYEPRISTSINFSITHAIF